MALHRDIYWIGRQWTVTGYGLQLIDQRLKGVFDIEISKLRDKGVLDAMRQHDWLKAEDFDKAIAAAHKRFPEPATPAPEKIKAALPVEMVLRLSEPASPPPPKSPAPEKFLSRVLGLGAEGEIARAGPPSISAPCAATQAVAAQLGLAEPVSAAPPRSPDPVKLPPVVAGLRNESELVKPDVSGNSGLLAELQFRPGERAAPASAKSPLSAIELRIESERARADLESKMSALDGLLRSRGFVAARPSMNQPSMTQPSIPAVQAEGELAKFAPQWRVRN